MTVASTGLSWMPLISATPVWPAKYGSSPKASELRPFIGKRAMFTSGASCTLMPLCHASLPSALPNFRCRAVSQLDACAIADGNAVVLTSMSPTPWPASFSTRSGMQRAGLPGM